MQLFFQALQSWSTFCEGFLSQCLGQDFVGQRYDQSKVPAITDRVRKVTENLWHFIHPNGRHYEILTEAFDYFEYFFNIQDGCLAGSCSV
jgi:hypothetical protein